MGTVPPKLITQTALARPRTESWSRPWNTVASEVTVAK